MRPINRTYYYIDYRQTIDAIKWRVYKIDKDMQGVTVPANEKKEYFCARCKAEWTQMEVLDNFSPEHGFLCHRCGYVLTHDVERQSGSHQKSTRMNTQFKFITEMLQRIDAVVVPDNDFDSAFTNRRVVVRDTTHQIADSNAFEAMERPTAVKGTNTGSTKITVEFASGDGPSEEEKAAELARKEKIAKQNALPEWMATSTVSGDAHRFDATPSLGVSAAVTPTEKKPVANDDAALDALFDNIEKSRKRDSSDEEGPSAKKVKVEEPDEDEDDSDDDDVDFEDV